MTLLLPVCPRDVKGLDTPAEEEGPPEGTVGPPAQGLSTGGGGAGEGDACAWHSCSRGQGDHHKVEVSNPGEGPDWLRGGTSTGPQQMGREIGGETGQFESPR